jgi:hypothetical protein
MMMKTILTGLLALALLALPLAPAIQTHSVSMRVAEVSAQPLGNAMFWWFQLRDERNQALTDTSARCFVYTAGTDTLATIYTDQTLATAAANPVIAAALGSSVGQSCAFFTATSVTSVDVIAWSKRGRSRISGYTPAGSAGHFLVLSQQMNSRLIQVPFAGNVAPSVGTSYVNTGVTIPKGFLIRDVLVQVTTAGAAGSHLTVGILEGNPGGLCASGVTKVQDNAGASAGGKALPAAGWSHCGAYTQSTVAANLPSGVAADFFYTAFHSGQLISRGSIGNNTAGVIAGAQHAGSYYRFPFVGDGVVKTLSYHVGTANGGNPLSTVAGYFYIIGNEVGNDF